MAHKRKNKLKRLKEWAKSHKILVIAALLVIIVSLFSAKIMLYFNILVGRDIVVRLDVDKKNMSLIHGQSESIVFEASVLTNPFCEALCTSDFIDISNDLIVEKDEFRLRAGSPIQKEYMIKAADIGTGLEIYRFDMQCQSLSTLLCHTREEPSTRSILISVLNELSSEEKQLKESLREMLENLAEELGFYEEQELELADCYKELNITIALEDRTYEMQLMNEMLLQNIEKIKKIWENEDYYLLQSEIETAKKEFQKSKKLFEELNRSLYSSIFLHNLLIDELNASKKRLDMLKGIAVTDEKKPYELNQTIGKFNSLLAEFQKRGPIENKTEAVKVIGNEAEILEASIKEHIRRYSIGREIEIILNYDALREISSQSITHAQIQEIAEMAEFELNSTCSKIDVLRGIFEEINNSIKVDFENQSYPDSDGFRSNITSKIINLKQKISSGYIESIDENKANYGLIKEYLAGYNAAETEDYPEYNLTPALLAELISKQPDRCSLSAVEVIKPDEISIKKITINKTQQRQKRILFEEPVPKCCVFEDCRECCISDECKNDPLKFPVVFLHGHAIDKDSSAEYSLEGFNKIQKRLEEDGYLNAGPVTLYTEKDAAAGILGLIQAPLTIRASYYFDVFKEPENYVVVQAKSENIDTYSIRLKELVDIVKYKTGRPKVNIVAFSMGGLVARRYIQIFGTESVHKLILIGTPNKGIAGRIASYCPITGENLECRDMNSESLFINKLNREPLPDIPIYNIIGTGCVMDSKKGDGVVLEENVFLEGAHNYVIEGECQNKAAPLHLNLRDIDLYPQVYSIIKSALNE